MLSHAPKYGSMSSKNVKQKEAFSPLRARRLNWPKEAMNNSVKSKNIRHHNALHPYALHPSSNPSTHYHSHSTIISLLRVIGIFSVISYHFQQKNYPGIAHVNAPFSAVMTLPWLAGICGYLESRSNTLVHVRLMYLSILFLLCVIVNSLCIDWKGEWRNVGGVSGMGSSLKESTVWWKVTEVLRRNGPNLVYHGGFVLMMMGFTVLVRPFRWYVRLGEVGAVGG